MKNTLIRLSLLCTLLCGLTSCHKCALIIQQHPDQSGNMQIESSLQKGDTLEFRQAPPSPGTKEVSVFIKFLPSDPCGITKDGVYEVHPDKPFKCKVTSLNGTFLYYTSPTYPTLTPEFLSGLREYGLNKPPGSCGAACGNTIISTPAPTQTVALPVTPALTAAPTPAPPEFIQCQDKPSVPSVAPIQVVPTNQIWWAVYGSGSPPRITVPDGVCEQGPTFGQNQTCTIKAQETYPKQYAYKVNFPDCDTAVSTNLQLTINNPPAK